MYERYYGLKEKPFSLTPDPDFLFVNKYVRGALDNVIYGIQRQEGFTAIVGDVGTGKTTLCWALLGKLDKSIRTALILNPLLNEEDMLKAILQDFGVKPKFHAAPATISDPDVPYDPSWMQGLTRKELVDELNRFLLEGSEEGVFNILIVDEAQNLSLGVLEQLRILSNLETAKKKLLQIIFVGQLEFQDKLNLPQLRQLDQRITIRYSLKPMSKVELVQYIEHRLSVAGSKGSVGFTRGALKAIYSYSKGYPRLINIICDRSLLAGYSEKARLITAKMVHKAARGIRGKEKGSGLRMGWSWRVVLPVAAVLALVLLLAAIYAWVWRGSVPYLSRNPLEPDESLASTRPEPDPATSRVEDRTAPPAEQPRPAVPAVVPAPKPPDGPPAPSERVDDSINSLVSEFKGKFLLQVHSLKSKDQADAALADLNGAGFASFYRIEEVTKGRQWYVIYAGPYDTVRDAQDRADSLRQAKKLRPIIRGF